MGYKKQKSGIYAILINNCTVYIGQTKQHRTRWQSHKRSLESNCHVNQYLQNKYNKYKNATFIMLEESSLDNLSSLEKKWVDFYGYDNLCNLQYPDITQKYITSKETIDKILNSRKGYKHSDLTRRKMALSQSGDKNHMYGKKQCVEANTKRSNSLSSYYQKHTHHSKGVILSNESRLKRSKTMKNTLKNPETRASYIARLPKMNSSTAEKIAKTLYRPINEDLFDNLIELGVRKKDIQDIFEFSDTKYYAEMKKHKERKDENRTNETRI